MSLTYEEFKQAVLEQALLREMPKYRAQTKDQSSWIGMTPDGKVKTNISFETVERKFERLSKVTDNKIIGEYEVLLSKTKGMAGLYIPGVNPDTGEAVYYVACLVYFKTPLIDHLPEKVKAKQQLQVDRVATVIEFESMGLASIVYTTLTDYDYVVVSDSIQYDGGKQLWKKLSKSHSLNVYVYDRETKDFLKDESGHDIRYDTKNLTDDKIWLPCKPGQRFILLAHK